MIKAGRSVEFRGMQWKNIIHRIKKAGHNGEISYKSGTLVKISSNRRVKKAGCLAKTGQLASMLGIRNEWHYLRMYIYNHIAESLSTFI